MQIAKMNDAIRRKEKEEKLGKDAPFDASLDEDDGDCNDDDRCLSFSWTITQIHVVIVIVNEHVVLGDKRAIMA